MTRTRKRRRSSLFGRVTLIACALVVLAIAFALGLEYWWCEPWLAGVFAFVVFVPLTTQIRLQLNVENLFNARYYVNADSNTNISPGSPRAIRVALITRF